MSDNLTSTDLQAYLDKHQIDGQILHLDVPTPTVPTAADAVGAQVQQIVKTLLFLVNGEPVVAIACGVDPVDRRPIAELLGVGKKRVKLANADQVSEITGYSAGAVPPFGHRRSSRTLIDPQVVAQETVYAGGGDENALMRLSPKTILAQTQAEVLSLLSPPKNS
ncbi:MAG: YbaK/EbsC family protein [Anaerolineales bacterium]|nr:YbaK/EbsC family protein [Anaerolineales bacterium]